MATTIIAIDTMKLAHVPEPGADFQIVERKIQAPSARACGICHSDVLTKDGA